MTDEAQQLQIAIFRSVGAPQSRSLELSRQSGAQQVSGDPRVGIAASNQGAGDVVFFNPSGARVTLESGAQGMLVGLDPDADVWVELA